MGDAPKTTVDVVSPPIYAPFTQQAGTDVDLHIVHEKIYLFKIIVILHHEYSSYLIFVYRMPL